MTIGPILFSAPMVNASLDGRKTMTRRALKPQPDHCHRDIIGKAPPYDPADWNRLLPQLGERELPLRFAPGDLLWVRETWKAHSTFEGTPPRHIPPSRIFYAADDTYAPSGSRWRPAIHMPRWASRLTLAVTAVKVERLQDISEEDAEAEGARIVYGEPFDPNSALTCRRRFELLWDHINGVGAWEANPWVVALTFTVHKANVDAVAPAGPAR